MPANLENSAVAAGLEKVSFHSNPRERQCQRMLKLPYNCVGDKKNKRKAGPGNGCKKFIIIDKLDAIRHETLGTSPEGTVHNLENKI